MQQTLPQTIYRYERKYLSENFLPAELEKFILIHPGMFREVYHPRQVWSMYFDTPEQDYYLKNLLGHYQRVKVRVRWYTHNGQVDPLQIEVKQRDGEVMAKLTYPLPLTMKQISIAELTELVRQRLTPHLSESGVLQPVMVNHYQRSYYTSSQHAFRLTLDSQLNFATLTDWQQNRSTCQLPFTILEVKYPTANDPSLSKIIQSLPLQVSKSSKFIMGMRHCYPNDIYYD